MLAGMPGLDVTCVVSAAVGGIVLGYEAARQLGTRAIFVEKEAGTARFRRGFGVAPGERVLVVEDVITTGLSVREVIDVVTRRGWRLRPWRRWSSGAAAVDVGAPLYALLDLPMDSFEPDACPQCAAGEAARRTGLALPALTGAPQPGREITLQSWTTLLARPPVRQLQPYSAGTTIDQAKRRFDLDRVIKLSSNENPRGSSPKALAAMAARDRRAPLRRRRSPGVARRGCRNRTVCASRTRSSATAATRSC